MHYGKLMRDAWHLLVLALKALQIPWEKPHFISGQKKKHGWVSSSSKAASWVEEAWNNCSEWSTRAAPHLNQPLPIEAWTKDHDQQPPQRLTIQHWAQDSWLKQVVNAPWHAPVDCDAYRIMKQIDPWPWAVCDKFYSNNLKNSMKSKIQSNLECVSHLNKQSLRKLLLLYGHTRKKKTVLPCCLCSPGPDRLPPEVNHPKWGGHDTWIGLGVKTWLQNFQGSNCAGLASQVMKAVFGWKVWQLEHNQLDVSQFKSRLGRLPKKGQFISRIFSITWA